jgi:hypothetical protein
MMMTMNKCLSWFRIACMSAVWSLCCLNT